MYIYMNMYVYPILKTDILLFTLWLFTQLLFFHFLMKSWIDLFRPIILFLVEDDKSEEIISLQKIFLFGSPDLYYRAIEYSLLLQCVYIALWCTNFTLVGIVHSIRTYLSIILDMPFNEYHIFHFSLIIRSFSNYTMLIFIF